MPLPSRRCECGAADCTVSFAMTHEEQDAVDHDPRNLWVVARAHTLRGAKDVVVIRESADYTVVEVEERHS
jgi:hypothetical protein